MKKQYSKKSNKKSYFKNKKSKYPWAGKSGIKAKSPFPFAFNTTFNLNQFLNIYGTGPQTYVFRLNSLFSFNQTGTGGQPYYYDQLSAIYAKYRVYSVDMQLTFTTSNSTYSQMLIVTPKDSATAFSSMQQALEFPASRAHLVAPVGSGDVVKVVKAKYNVAKILGYTANIDDDLAAAVNAAPTKVAYLLLTVDTTISGNITGVQAWAKFRIHAKMYEPVLVSVSLNYPQLDEVNDDDSENSCVITTKTQQYQKIKDSNQNQNTKQKMK